MHITAPVQHSEKEEMHRMAEANRALLITDGNENYLKVYREIINERSLPACLENFH